MPNKYSHAFVLSNYDARGLATYDRPPASKNITSTYVKPVLRSPRPPAQTPRSGHAPPRTNPSNRIRIGSPSPPPSKAYSQANPSSRIRLSSPNSPPSNAFRQPHRSDRLRIDHSDQTSPNTSPQSNCSNRIFLGSPDQSLSKASVPPPHRKTSSIETEIYAPDGLASPPPTQEPPTSSGFDDRPLTSQHPSSTPIQEDMDTSRRSIETQVYASQSPQPPKSSPFKTDWSRSSEVKARRRASQASPINVSRPGSRGKWSIRSGSSTSRRTQSPIAPKSLNESVSIEGQAFIAPNPASPSVTHAPSQSISTEEQEFTHSRPPSPSATPDSCKSFGLETHLDRLDKMRLTAPKVVESGQGLDLDFHSDRVEKEIKSAPVKSLNHSKLSSESIVILPQITLESGRGLGHATRSDRLKGKEIHAPPVVGSDETLAVETNLDRRGKTTSPPSVPERSIRRIAPESPTKRSSMASTEPHPQRAPSKTKTTSLLPSPTFSMTTQTSSRHSATVPTPPVQLETSSTKHTRTLHSPNSSMIGQTSSRQSAPSPAHSGTYSRDFHSPTFSITTHTSSRQSTTSLRPRTLPETSSSKSVRSHHFPNSSTSTQASTQYSKSPAPGDQPRALENESSIKHYIPSLSVSTQTSSHGSVASPRLQARPEPLRPNTSTSNIHSPAFTIMTRTSSLNATTSRPMLPRASSMPSKAFANDDADLDSLPSTLEFDDFSVTPWAYEHTDPVIFRHTPSPERSSSSRSSSFDSAVPPPIGRVPLSPKLTEKPILKTPKKGSRLSISSLLFSRHQPPLKAVLYSETVPGTRPTPVTVTRTGATAIPALFPTYKGAFPPPLKSEERVGRRMSQSSTNSRRRPSRGVSQGTAEKRRSWFRREDIDRGFGLNGGEPVKQKTIDEFFKANLKANIYV